MLDGLLERWVHRGHITRRQAKAILADEDRTAVAALVGLSAALLLSFAVTARVFLSGAANETDFHYQGTGHLVVGGAVVLAALLVPLQRHAREGTLVAGIGTMCFVNLFAEGPAKWALVPGLAAAWLSLAVHVSPGARLALTGLAAVAALGVANLLVGSSEGPLLVALSLAHLATTWLVLAPAEPARRWIAFFLVALLIASALVGIWFVASGVTWQRIAFVVGSIAAAAAAYLLQGRSWHLEPPLGKSDAPAPPPASS